ncbi:hypothetical protein AGR8A_Cc30250 [Agrobacterium fabrum str. J-07]|nr:hypothetical protein AGR8A_Cc30250 [Agrobacterium fabrum str. J-07]
MHCGKRMPADDGVEDFSAVMLGLVPSICYLSAGPTWLDPRDKPEDDATQKRTAPG